MEGRRWREVLQPTLTIERISHSALPGAQNARAAKLSAHHTATDQQPMQETRTHTKVKGRTTFRIASVLFLLSAVFELVGLSSAVLLLGAFRSGVAAALYHLFYGLMYLALGIGLWRASHWSYRLVFAATVIITLDKLQYVIYRETILVDLMRHAGAYRQLLQAIDPQMMQQVLMLVAMLFAACWWGFAAYTYFRRDYFRPFNRN